MSFYIFYAFFLLFAIGGSVLALHLFGSKYIDFNNKSIKTLISFYLISALGALIGIGSFILANVILKFILELLGLK
mgnify:CR=1 FL=1